MKNYIQLEQIMKQVNHINNVMNLQYWDITVNMPKGSADSKTQDIIALNSIIQQKLKSNETIDLLKQAQAESAQLNEWQLANLRLIDRRITKTMCVDDALRERFISATTQCELVWRKARAENDYETLKPYLQEVLSCVQEIAKVKSQKFNCLPYDALLEEYDPGSTSEEIKVIFATLKKKLPNLIKEIQHKQKHESVVPLTEMDTVQQKLISKKIVEMMGFDFTKGRLDESEHPFCRGNPEDVRLTSRYDKNNFLSGIMASMHEAGHGLYEQNLPSSYRNQFVGMASGMSVHESQSLLMEMQVGRSQEFMQYLAKVLRDDFQCIGPEYSSDNLYKLVTRVKPIFIRINSDEVTYSMHVILRYEIEEALISGDLSLDELPSYWNQKIFEYLGISCPSNKLGCLQDIHWPLGDFGYFPTYVKGAIIAAMVMQTTNDNIRREITEGKFESLNQFLNKGIRNWGSLKLTNDLIQDITGEAKINPDIFLTYLEQKYLGSV